MLFMDFTADFITGFTEVFIIDFTANFIIKSARFQYQFPGKFHYIYQDFTEINILFPHMGMSFDMYGNFGIKMSLIGDQKL